MKNMTELTQKSSVVFKGVLTNIVLFGVTFILGIVGRSQALIADSFDTFADTIGDLVIFFGLRVSDKPPDEEHPYGHRKIESIVVGIVGSLLFLTVLVIAGRAVFSVVRGIKQQPKLIALGGAVLTIVVKELLFRYLRSRAKRYESPSIMAGAYHARADVLSSVASSAGITLALLGYPIFDPIFALIICIMIARTGVKLIRFSVNELTDKAIEYERKEEIIDFIKGFPELKGVHAFKTRRAGGKIYINCHIQFEPDLSLEDAHSMAHKIKDALEERYPEVEDFLVHIEPDEKRSTLPGDIEARLEAELGKFEEIKSCHGFTVFHSKEGNCACLHVEVRQDISVKKAHSVAAKVEMLLKKLTGFPSSIVHIDVEGVDEDL